jgi:hypothetical protein
VNILQYRQIYINIAIAFYTIWMLLLEAMALLIIVF